MDIRKALDSRPSIRWKVGKFTIAGQDVLLTARSLSPEEVVMAGGQGFASWLGEVQAKEKEFSVPAMMRQDPTRAILFGRRIIRAAIVEGEGCYDPILTEEQVHKIRFPDEFNDLVLFIMDLSGMLKEGSAAATFRDESGEPSGDPGSPLHGEEVRTGSVPAVDPE